MTPQGMMSQKVAMIHAYRMISNGNGQGAPLVGQLSEWWFTLATMQIRSSPQVMTLAVKTPCHFFFVESCIAKPPWNVQHLNVLRWF
jgi:hypothetical protein